MGFLDSEFGRILVGQTRYGQEMMAREREQMRSQQFRELVGGYAEHSLPPDQAGPVQPARPIDQSFALRASAIPGYQQYGQQVLGDLQRQQGVMDLQRQGQEWSQNNESLSQRLAREQAGQQFDRSFGSLSAQQKAMLGLEGQRLAQQQQQWGSISPYQQAVLGLQGREQLFREQQASGKTYGALPGSPLYDTQMQDLQVANSGLEAINKLSDLWGSTGMAPGVFDRDKLAAARPYKTLIVGAIAKLAGSGTLDKAEAERYTEMLGEPGFFSSNKRTVKVLSEIGQILQRQQESVLERNPNLPRLEAPPGFSRAGGR